MPRHVVFKKTGGPEVLEFVEEPAPTPGDGEIRLKVEAIGLNRAEIMFREGQYIEQPAFPARIGYEAAGVVEAVGPGVKGIAEGDRVATIPAFSMNEYGMYGERVLVPAHAAAHYPDHLSPAEAAATWMQYLTAYGALVDIGKLAAGQNIVITAASSSVGIAAIQMAKDIGATAIATTRTQVKKPALLKAGADHVIVTEEEDLAERVMGVTDGHGAHMAFDPVAGPMLQKLGAAAARGATIFVYGALSPEPTPYPLFEGLSKGLWIRGYTLFELGADSERMGRARSAVVAGLARGAYKPLIARTFPFDEIADAQRFMASNQQIGKIVVEV